MSTGEDGEDHTPDGWFNLYERLQTQEINPQLSSPLFNGRIPAEIRTLIFEFAVTESPSPKARTLGHDACFQNSHDLMPVPEPPTPSIVENVVERVRDQIQGVVRPRHGMRPFTTSHIRQPQDGFDWLRHDNTEPMSVGTALLLTCRRAYLETHSLPLLQTEQRFYCHRGPFAGGGQAGSRSDIAQFVNQWLGGPSTVPGQRQWDRVRMVRLFTQQFWLEDNFLNFVSGDLGGETKRAGRFANIEHLRITLRRTDWWEWEQNRALRINPFRGNCYHANTKDFMRNDMQETTTTTTGTGNGNGGSGIPFREGAWGKAFAHMPRLRTLTIDFETTEDKRDEMDLIVAWAMKAWKFPLGNSNGQRYLSPVAEPPVKTSWRGLPHHWSDTCPKCLHHVRYSPRTEGCDKCKETRQLTSQRLGPQLFVWTCLWAPVEG